MAITHVNSASINGAGTSGNITVTVPNGTGIQAGDLIVCCCVSNGTHVANGMTVKDSVNNTNYTVLLEQEESSASSFYQDTKYFQTPVAIADGSTFTFTPFASFTIAAIAIDVFRGCSGVIDKAAVGATAAASATIACPALGANATAGALVISLAAGGGAFTLTQSTLTTGSVNTATRNCGIAYLLSASGSNTYAVNWTQGSSSSWAGQTVSFSAAPSSGDIPQIQPGPAWLDLFKPWVQRPRPFAPAVQNVTSSGGFTLAPLALSAQGAQTSPDQPQAQPGPVWLDLFKPGLPKPRQVTPPPGPPAVSASGSFSLAPLAFAAQGGQTSPDIPQAGPGPSWLRLFRPQVQRPFPPPPATQAVSGTGSLSLAPLALSGAGAQTSPDQPSAQPGPLWLRLFRPWLQRPLPPPPAFQSVNAAGSFSLAPLAFSATAGQSSPDLPAVQPGPFWARLFRLQAPKPLPPLPATQAVSASGSFSLAPLALSGQGAQTAPDLPQIAPGPLWLRLLRPQVRRPLPPVPAVQSVTSSGSFGLAPLALSGSSVPPLQDQPQVTPGPAWLRFFKPWVQRPVPPALATQAVTSSGSLALAPLALAGQAGQSAPDQPKASPGPSWLRFFRPWQSRPYPPVPATPAAVASGSLPLAPVALSGTGTVTGGGAADLPQIQPGPRWLRLFKPWLPRPAPQPPGAAATAAPVPPPVLYSLGPARLPWTTGSARQTWTTGRAQ